MLKYVVKRILTMIPLLIVITMLTYLLIALAPGDPAEMYLDPTRPRTPEMLERIRKDMGLDAPVFVRYLKWLGQLVQGNLGYSMFTGRPVMMEIADRLPITVALSATSILISTVLGISIGVFVARHQYQWIDYVVSVLTFVGISVPSFWMAMMLILLFTEKLGWLPSVGLRSMTLENPTAWEGFLDLLKHLIMPIFVLSVTNIADWTRYQRSSYLEIANQDFVRTARAKGISEKRVVWKHIVRNSAMPLITLAGGILPSLIGGAYMVETIFAIPGMGRLSVDAIAKRDYTLIMGTGFFSSVLILVGMLISDLLYAAVDPRIRYQ